MKKEFPRLNFLFLLLALVAWFGSFLAGRQIYRTLSDYDGLRQRAETALQAEEKRINSFLDKMEQNFSLSNDFNRTHQRYLATINQNISGFTLFIFFNDSLCYWSDNTVWITSGEAAGVSNQQGINQGNGFYELFKRQAGGKKIVALLKIKNEFAIENQYLVNGFNSVLKLPPRARISPVTSDRIFPVRNSLGQTLFSLSFIPIADDLNGSNDGMLPGILSLLGIIFFMVFVFLLTRHLLRKAPWAGLMVILAVIALRMLCILNRFPEAIYNLTLFSPKYYASSYMLYSLGDLLISSLVFCYIITSLTFYLNAKKYSVEFLSNQWGISIRILVIWLFTFLFSVLINYLLSSLIINSRISFNINNIFELTGFSIVGFIIIGLLLFSFYLVCDSGIRFVMRTGFSYTQLGILFLITQGLFLVILINLRDNELFRNYGISAFILANVLILFIGIIRHRTGRAFSFSRSTLFILAFSVYAAQTIFNFNVQRERENRKALASKLENAQDAIAEYLFDEVISKARNDRYLAAYFSSTYEHQLITANSDNLIERRLMQQYFTGYWNKYDIRIKAFNADGLPINAGGDPSWSLDRIDNLIENSARPTYSNGFYLLNSETGSISYIGKINIAAPAMPDSIIGTLVVEMSSKFLKEDAGYPDLLISNKISLNRDVSSYSYARYRHGIMTNQFGRYAYNLNQAFYEHYIPAGQQESFADFDNRSHFLYRPSPDSLIIISMTPPGLLELVTLFSYIFSFFCLIFIFLYGITRLVELRFRLQVNFKMRIQFTVISIVIITMLLIGISTVTYIIDNYSNTQSIRLKDKLNSMLAAINKDIGEYSGIGSTLSNELESKFYNLYQTVDVDFNLYNSAGFQVFTTQPKLFDQKIMAVTMNRQAYNVFITTYPYNYINFESIGSLGFQAGYAAIRNTRNQVIGYLNLPYFARESELKKEISSFLVALINIYVLLFAFSVMVTFIISNRITRPLRIIQERMSKVKLGKRNERIQWKRNDEIGDLINEYNRMIDELSESAQRLAKSERETAWREMAKQVAHEIKNPLTPMKLSVQHLQRAWKDKHENMEDIVQRFSQTIIEQIDTLSGIATEFSNFAKMPGANFSPVNISMVIRNSVNLYSEAENVTVKLYDFTNGELEVYADKDQLHRVFSNLLKNAIQAIPHDMVGEIIVKLTHNDDICMIAVADNGKGIPEENISKIFNPNFTTKSGGTGLGLAMVKNIIDQSGGKIWFDTQAGRGTTFYVQLPVYKGIEIS